MMSIKLQKIFSKKENWSKESLDNPICRICKKQILHDIPIRMWTEDGELEIDFHFECLKKEGFF